MKKTLSLVLAMVLLMGMGVFAEEKLSATVGEAYADSLREQMSINKFIMGFEGDAEKTEAFLALVDENKAEGVELDDRELHRLAREIKYAGIEPATPIKIVRDGETQSLLRSGSSVSPEISVDNLTFAVGVENPVPITSMQGGFVRCSFDVTNSGMAAEPVTAIVRLININTNAMHNLTIVQRTIGAESDETITAGFNVPADAENYHIKIELWDDLVNMNSLVSEITFPQPHMAITLGRGYTHFSGTFAAIGDVTVEYEQNNIMISAVYESNGTNRLFSLSGLTSPEIIVNGDLTYIDLYGSNISAADTSGLSNLTWLSLTFNNLNSFDATGLPSLTYLGLGENNLSSFDTTGLSSLSFLSLYFNNLNSFDASDLSSLTTLLLEHNNLSTFDATDLSALTNLCLWHNNLSSFDASGLSNLTHLYLDENNLSTFDASGLTSLISLSLDYNNLSAFDATGLSNLTTLGLGGNNLSSFDASGLTSLIGLSLDYNNLSAFDATGLSNLTHLGLYGNNLSSFDASGLSSLKELSLAGNNLSSFDATGLSNLTYLNLELNDLSSFDASELTSIIYLCLNDNYNLSSLTLPQFDAASGVEGFVGLYLSNTALSNMTTPNSAWDGIISKLPARSANYKGSIYVDNAALRNALNSNAALSGKNWVAN